MTASAHGGMDGFPFKYVGFESTVLANGLDRWLRDTQARIFGIDCIKGSVQQTCIRNDSHL